MHVHLTLHIFICVYIFILLFHFVAHIAFHMATARVLGGRSGAQKIGSAPSKSTHLTVNIHVQPYNVHKNVQWKAPHT